RVRYFQPPCLPGLVAGCGLTRMRVYRLLEGNEQHARIAGGATGFVRRPGGPVGVHAGTQHDRLLAVIGHLEFARHEHHALGGGMPVACDLRTAGDLEVDVRIRRRGIPLEYGDLAALREKLRTWP